MSNNAIDGPDTVSRYEQVTAGRQPARRRQKCRGEVPELALQPEEGGSTDAALAVYVASRR